MTPAVLDNRTIYTRGTFGDGPESEAAAGPMTLVCVSCGDEVCLVTADDLAAMETLPDHDCKARRAA